MVPKQPLVSIIMPAYNVAPYVCRAVESLQHQSFADFELLVVDDGSTDRTGAILDSISERDVRISVFHTKNGGAPAARNLALAHAQGTYVMFFDADDWAETRMLADMVAFASAGALELVIAGFYIDTYYGRDNEHTSEIKNYPTQVFANQTSFRSQAYALFDNNLLYTPWNKLFLRSRIEELQLRFRDTFWDDFPFVLDYIRDVEKVGVMAQPYYHFIRARQESETSRWRKEMYEKREEEHEWMCDLYTHWHLENDPASIEMIQRRYIERLIGCIENICNPACTLSRKEKLAEIKRMISTSRAQKAVLLARPKSRMMSCMLMPIRMKSEHLALREGMVISFVKRKCTRMFALLKSRR